jgi:hypothetical protein
VTGHCAMPTQIALCNPGSRKHASIVVLLPRIFSQSSCCSSSPPAGGLGPPPQTSLKPKPQVSWYIPRHAL